MNYVSCEGDGDGSLTTSIQGGVPPYYFQWLDAQGNIISQEQDILNLSSLNIGPTLPSFFNNSYLMFFYTHI